MSDDQTTISFKRSIPAPPEEVFPSFSTAQGWRGWLCDSARFQTRTGRNYQLSWDNGWYTAGSILNLDSPKTIELTWRGEDDPASTQVQIELALRGEGSEVQVRHAGFGQGETWDKVREEARKGWEMGLENLESIFTTGVDLRVVRRPMLGIMMSDFNAEIATEIGVPVSEGVRIDRAVEGMGAQRAGIQANDVLVEMDGTPVTGFGVLGVILQRHTAGDVIPVTLFRGSEKLSLDMDLSRRPIPEIPLDPVKLASQVRPLYQTIQQELQALFAGVSEAEADFQPGPDEWSAKESLAHLVDGEQIYPRQITEFILDSEQEGGESWTNLRLPLAGLIHIHPTIQDLLEELKRRQEETLYMLEHAEALKTKKGVMWRLGRSWLEIIPLVHERGHMEQMRAAIEAARAREGVSAGG